MSTDYGRLFVTIGVLLVWTLMLPAQSVAMEPIQHWQLDNGARVYFVPAPELPILDVRVVFDAASSRDGTRPGLAELTNLLLDKGAGGISADELASQVEGLGAHLGGGSLRDMAWVSLRTLSDERYLQPAVKLLSMVVTSPDFNNGDFERERERMLVAVKMQEQQPSSVASRAYYKAVYGEHPYATPPDGYQESLARIVLDEVKAFYRRYYTGSNALVVIVGDLDRAAAEKVARQVAGGLPKGETAGQIPEVPPVRFAAEERIFHPSTQSHVLVGAPGMRRGDPDYFPLYVGNHILGGSGLVSLLSEEVREKRGLSYSVYSYFSPMRRKGPFTLGLQTRNEQLDEALEVMRSTLERFRSEGPSAQELEAAKKNITGGFALRTDSNAKIIEYLAMIGYYGLPLDYLDTFNDKVDAVTRDQIRDAFARRVDPERMVTVVVGGNGADNTPKHDSAENNAGD